MKKIMRALRKLRYFMPQTLPVTPLELDQFSRSIFETYDFPDMPGYRQTVATAIMHLKPLETKKSKRFFYKIIKKAQVNEIAYQALVELKEKAKNDTEGVSKTSA